jgi:hypothetical protein
MFKTTCTRNTLNVIFSTERRNFEDITDINNSIQQTAFINSFTFKAYCGERAWNTIHNRLQGPYYLSRVDHVWKIRDRKHRTDIGKYSFVNRTIQYWNQLPAEVLGTFPCKPEMFTELGKQLKMG